MCRPFMLTSNHTSGSSSSDLKADSRAASAVAAASRWLSSYSAPEVKLVPAAVGQGDEDQGAVDV